MVRRTSWPGVPGETTVAVSGIGWPRDVALEVRDPRRAAERVLIGLLHAVLAGALAVHEAEELRAERRVAAAAGLRIHPERLGFERDPGEAPVRAGRPDLVGDRRLDLAGEDEVALVDHQQLVAKRRRRRVIEHEDADQLVAGRLPLLGREDLRVGDQPVPLDGRREDHRPAAVVDVAAPAGLLDLDRGLGDGLGGEVVALEDLPVREPADDRDRGHHEDQQQEQQPRSRIRSDPAWFARSPSGRAG